LQAMGGASLALGLVNATGFAFGAGLCGALETVLSHSFGLFLYEEKKRKAAAEAAAARDGTEVQALVPHTLHIYGIYAQRMVLILLVAAIPLGIILCFADAFLTAVGQSPSIVHYTGMWCRWGVFGIPSAMAFQLLQRYYSCQHLTKPLPVALFGAAFANPVLQYVFVKLFGFSGSPIAWLVLMTGTVAGLIAYLRFTGIYRTTWGGWDIRCTQNVGSLVGVALPSMGMMLSEWVALEVNGLAGGYGTKAELGAYTITLQIFGVMWAMGSGVMILTSVFVGNAVGEGKPLLARRIAFTAIVVVVSVATLDVVLCLLLESFIPALFVKKDEIAEVTPIYRELMYIVMPYHFFDVFQSTVMGIFRGCEMQKIGAVIITVAFCVVGVPCSFLLFFYFKIGIKALWIGPFVGVASVGAPIYIYMLLRYIKWSELKPHSDHSAPANRIDAAETSTTAPAPVTAQQQQPADPNLDSTAGTPTAAQVAAVREFVDAATPATTTQRVRASLTAEKAGKAE
jgi:multidrug resistance protein, MATE family